MAAKKRVSIQDEDLNMLREIYTMVGEMKGIVEATRDQTAENTRTLRGHNGTPGLMTWCTNMESRVGELDGKIEAVKTTIKDVPVAIQTWKQYPSLTYLVRHNFKEMAVITAAAVTVTIALGFPDPTRAEQIRNLIELLFAKWLRL